MHRWQKLLSVALLAIPLWFVGKTLHGWWPTGVLILTGLAGLNAVTCWLLRYHRELLTWTMKVPGLQHYVSFVCRVTGEQLPYGSARTDAHEGLALKTIEDFDLAAKEARAWVRGQPAAIDGYLGHIRDVVILRQRLQTKTDQRPLSAFLLAGPAGIGKRYLSRVLGRLIFLQGADQVWELEKIGGDQVAALFGGPGAAGPLLVSVARQPFQTIILENVEAASPALQDVLKTVLQQGVWTNPANGRQVSFRNAIFVLTTTRCFGELRQLEGERLVDADRQVHITEILSSGTGLSPEVLTGLNETIVLCQPDDLTKAEVIVLAMCRECSKYGVQLEFVAPEILVQEVEQIRDGQGFLLLEDRTKKLLQPSLLEAARRHKRRLLLQAEQVFSETV